MSLNNQSNSLIPEIFDNPAWEDKIHIRAFHQFKDMRIVIIENHPDVLRTIQSTNPANLKPFTYWKLTTTGKIEFNNIGQPQIVKPSQGPRWLNSGINPNAMNHIHNHTTWFDAKKLQANDRDADDETY